MQAQEDGLMLTYEELLSLDRQNRGERILSVYLPRADHDPARRAERFTQLDGELSKIRRSLDEASRTERAAFERAADTLRESLGALGDWGTPVAGFASGGGTVWVGAVLASIGFIVRWRDGLTIAPYIRALKQERPVLVAVLDSREARLFRYRAGELVPLDVIEVEVKAEAGDHKGDSLPPGVRAGVRGATGRDETGRREEAAFQRLVNQVVQRIEVEATPDTELVLGGTLQPVRQVAGALPKSFEARMVVSEALTSTMTLPEIARAVTDAASDLTARRDAAWIATLLDQASGHGRSAKGLNETRRALAGRAVHELLLAGSFVDTHPDEAEELVRAALDGASRLEVAPRAAAARLEGEAEGVIARLRFPIPEGIAPAGGATRVT
jgi:hypothetical protein